MEKNKTTTKEDLMKKWVGALSSNSNNELKFDDKTNQLSINNNSSEGIDWSTHNPNNYDHNIIHTTHGNNNTVFTQPFDYKTDFQLDSDDLAINIEKLFTFENNKKEVLQEVIKSFINESDYNIKRMLLNTLESYGLIIDKKSLERKVKISGVLGDDDSDTETNI